MKYKDAIKIEMENLAEIHNSIFIGYNLKYGSKSYGTLLNVSGEKIIETPVAEALMGGLATGMSLVGFLPVLIFERHDFIWLATDVLINHLSKIEELSKGEFSPKVIIRMTVGGTKPFYPGKQHVGNYIDIFKNFTNFNVFEPKNCEEIHNCYELAKKSNVSSIISDWRDLYEEAY